MDRARSRCGLEGDDEKQEGKQEGEEDREGEGEDESKASPKAHSPSPPSPGPKAQGDYARYGLEMDGYSVARAVDAGEKETRRRGIDWRLKPVIVSLR